MQGCSEAAFAVDPFRGANGAIKKPRLAITDSFPLPTSSDRASIGNKSEGRIGAFDIKGTVKIKEKQPQQATIIEDQLAMLKEVYSDNNIDAECSKAADNMQEPRPPGDDCPEVGNLTIGQNNEVVSSSQPEDDVVPSSQPKEDPHEAKELSELEALLTSTAKASSVQIGKIAIVDDNEKSRLFGPQPSRVLRSQNRLSNRPLVPYDYTSPVIPRRNIKRSFEVQSDNDFIDDSAVNGNPKRTSNGRSTPAKDGKIPELPPDYDQTLEARNFITKGRKQCDETFGELSIKGYDLYSLRTRQYVNDLIIDNYLKLVCKRSLLTTNNYRKSYAFGTFFYTMLNNGQDQEKLASWVKENLFEFELLFLPINQENHWFLFVVDMFYAAKIKHEIEWDDWSTAPTAEQVGPNQTNGVDCGIFLCQYAEHLSRRAKLDFSQRGMVNYRKIMLYELMNGELLPKYDDVETSNQDTGS
uniref:Ubiquitin-like protease family profile domain-containing protein n=1 Tax=Panagrolaimus sp. PS1159 TaxID=55785 RepID=A0AC35FGX6_9BILA